MNETSTKNGDNDAKRVESEGKPSDTPRKLPGKKRHKEREPQLEENKRGGGNSEKVGETKEDIRSPIPKHTTAQD